MASDFETSALAHLWILGGTEGSGGRPKKLYIRIIWRAAVKREMQPWTIWHIVAVGRPIVVPESRDMPK